jgi:Flp pilus assembly protein TadG
VRCRGERGSVTVWFAVTALTLVLLVGLLVDGRVLLAARANAFSLAAEAARDGAQALEPQARSDGQVVLDPEGATQRATEFLTERGATGEVVVVGDNVTVTVHLSVPVRFLAVGSGGEVDISASATAHAAQEGGGAP